MDKWLSHHYSFKPITPEQPMDVGLLVADLIDKDSGCWKEEVVKELFRPCNVNLILLIPLCHAWPEDKFIWHFSTDGKFMVRSAYHLARSLKKSQEPSSSVSSRVNLWKLF